MKTLAAVDIGSNAIRVHICHLLQQGERHEFKTMEYIRIPLRLGDEVFTIGIIGDKKTEQLELLGQCLINLFRLYEVDAYKACATSAMREASNNVEVVGKIIQKTGFEIQIIDGQTEAEYAHRGLQKFLSEGTWVHLDVGGGSTEINLYLDKIKTASRSFKIGAVRVLMKEDVSAVKQEMIDWVKERVKPSQMPVYSLGTGGNIGKLHEMAGLSEKEPIDAPKIKEISTLIGNYSMEDRIHILKLNPDRADVILPASEIYLSVMEAAGATTMLVPKVGLTDGILEQLVAEN